MEIQRIQERKKLLKRKSLFYLCQNAIPEVLSDTLEGLKETFLFFF
jgi:hypothetical protein